MYSKKVTALALAAAAVFSLTAMTACGRSNEPVKSRRTNVYSGTELALPEGIQWISQMAATGDNIYIVYEKQVEVTHYSDGTTEENSTGLEPGYGVAPAVEVAANVAVIETEPAVEEVTDDGTYVTYENQTWVYTTNLDGSVTSSYQLEMPAETENGYMIRMSAADGLLYMLYETWGETTGFYLYAVDPAVGDVTKTYDLSGLGTDAGMTEDDYFYINNVAIDGDMAYMNIEAKILMYNLDTGDVAGVMEVDSVSWINYMYAADGNLYYSGYVDGSGQTLFTLDTATGESAVNEVTGLTYFNMIGVRDNMLCFQDQDGVIGWDTVTGETHELLNYINCDINSNEVNTIAVMPGDRFVYYSSTWDNETYVQSYTMTVLDRIPDEEMQEEIILTIASAYQNYELRNVVIDFNRQNTGVRLNIKTYDEYDNEENDWTGTVTQLNADITMGNVPDILVLDSNLPVESYYSKGVLTDLYPYMDDPENGVNRADYLENILKACEQEGKLYSLITCFYIHTLAAKESFVGTESGWTMSEMLDVLESMPEGMTAFYDYGRDGLKDIIMQFCGDTFLDWENGTTNFESEEFIRLIEFLKECPEKSVMDAYYENIDYENYDYEAEMEFYNNYEMRFYKDTALFHTATLSAINGYNQIYRTFAGDATMIGYPTNDETSSGAIIAPYLELGICTASPNRDSAWTFLKYLMTSEEYLEEAYGFVISKSWMEKKLEESEEYYADWYYEYTEEDWENMESQYSAEYIDYMKKSQTKYSLEQGRKIYDLVIGATKVQRSDKDLMAIINEELSTFFGGAKSAEETAKIIDSRARIYISENS